MTNRPTRIKNMVRLARLQHDCEVSTYSIPTYVFTVVSITA